MRLTKPMALLVLGHGLGDGLSEKIANFGAQDGQAAGRRRKLPMPQREVNVPSGGSNRWPIRAWHDRQKCRNPLLAKTLFPPKVYRKITNFLVFLIFLGIIQRVWAQPSRGRRVGDSGLGFQRKEQHNNSKKVWRRVTAGKAEGRRPKCWGMC